MRYQKPMRLLAAAGLLALLFCVPGLILAASAQIPAQPEGADHDGYADLAVGIPGLNIGGDDGAGGLGLFFGYNGGLSKTGAQYFDQDSPGVTGGPEPLDHFTQSLASGDFNRDGYIDLAIGVPDEDITVGETSYSNAGYVHVFYGGAGGISGSGSDVFDGNAAGSGTAANERWGTALASGDFNCDGYDDLAVGSPGEDLLTIDSAGMVQVLYGSSAGIKTSGSTILWQELPIPMPGTSEPYDNFGTVLAAGDFDGDGCHDLAMSAPNEALEVGSTIYSYAGMVIVAYGSPSGISGTGSELWYQGYSGLQDAVDDQDFFGDALAAGDFNKDGRDDLAIGVPKEDSYGNDSGIVQLLYGDFSGLTADYDLRLDQSMCAGYSIEEYNKYGHALAAGDFNNDGRDDLVVGAPGQSIDGADGAGMVCVLFGPNLATTTWAWNNPYAAEDDGFGSALAVGDVDDNGFDDLAVAAPFDDGTAADVGTVYLRRRTAANTWYTTVIFDLEDINGTLTPEADDEFGTAMAMLDKPNTHMTILSLPVVMK